MCEKIIMFDMKNNAVDYWLVNIDHINTIRMWLNEISSNNEKFEVLMFNIYVKNGHLETFIHDPAGYDASEEMFNIIMWLRNEDVYKNKKTFTFPVWELSRKYN